MTRTVGILLFDEVEVLDFAGPFEVFSVAGRRDGLELFDVFTVAENAGAVSARNRLQVIPTYSFADAPHIDVLVVPGGFGTRREMNSAVVVDWVKQRIEEAEVVLSVCTGALILAKAGLLDGVRSTTHHGAVDLLREVAPQSLIHGDQRIIDNGKLVIAAGVSSGIDASFHLLARLHGADVARENAAYIEYPYYDAVSAEL